MTYRQWSGVEYQMQAPVRQEAADPVIAVVQLLLRDRVRFIQILHSLQNSHIVSLQDTRQLQGIVHALKGSPARDVMDNLKALGQVNAQLLALLVAYAVYEVQETKDN